MAQEPPTHLSSETPSPAPDPPTAPTQASTGPAPGAAALQQPHAQPAGLAVPSQPVASVPERRPQLWPSSGGPLAAAPLPSGVLLSRRHGLLQTNNKPVLCTVPPKIVHFSCTMQSKRLVQGIKKSTACSGAFKFAGLSTYLDRIALVVLSIAGSLHVQTSSSYTHCFHNFCIKYMRGWCSSTQVSAIKLKVV